MNKHMVHSIDMMVNLTVLWGFSMTLGAFLVLFVSYPWWMEGFFFFCMLTLTLATLKAFETMWEVVMSCYMGEILVSCYFEQRLGREEEEDA